ncbi:hypothetical protein [Haliscomenobacter hydrossis]|nr:hypothetical protein [Haliscomenobacter hydrossis]
MSKKKAPNEPKSSWWKDPAYFPSIIRNAIGTVLDFIKFWSD